MPYLIDGNNLIGNIPDLSLGDRESRSQLVSRLRKYQRIKNTRVVVVFDGAPEMSLIAGSADQGPLSVLFPEPGRSADTLIEEIIGKETDLRRFFVVSSDREIRYSARKHGAKSLDCAEFHRDLKKALREYREDSELQKEVESPTPLEVRQWKEVFGKKP
jgi:predicted RNA-binding protein with PIN domain